MPRKILTSWMGLKPTKVRKFSKTKLTRDETLETKTKNFTNRPKWRNMTFLTAGIWSPTR